VGNYMTLKPPNLGKNLNVDTADRITHNGGSGQYSARRSRGQRRSREGALAHDLRQMFVAVPLSLGMRDTGIMQVRRCGQLCRNV
jgi:hypothetical protein